MYWEVWFYNESGQRISCYIKAESYGEAIAKARRFDRRYNDAEFV